MNEHSDETPEWEEQRKRIIGLGETSIRKSYYPELRQRILELETKNRELQVAYAEQTAIGEELRQQIDETGAKEQELRKSEKKYRDLLETTPDLIWEIDIQGRFTYLSPQIFSVLGFQKEDLEGKPFFTLIPPEYIPAAKKAYNDQVSNLSARVTLDVTALHRDGHRIELEIRSMALTDENGTATGFRGIARDISPQKLDEERIRKSERQLSTLLSNMPGMAYRCRNDTDWTMEFVSSGCVSLTGYEPAMLINSTALSYADLIHPDDREAVWNAVQEAVQDHRHFTLQYRIIAADQRQKWVWEQGACTEYSDGEPRLLEGFITDITDRKESEDALHVSEERYRSLVDITDTGYLVLDMRGCVIDANEVYVRLTGRESLLDLLGRPVTDWTAPYDLDRNAREVEECFRTGHIRNLEIDYIRPDGAIMPVEINATVFHTVDSNVILTLCRDISDRKRINVALQQARNKLNLLNAVTFQDIQTAAFSLSAYQELVKTVLVDPKATSYLEKQEIFLKKMIDTLDFAKNYQEMGMHPPRWQNVRQVFLYAISHLDFLHMKQNLVLENLEIFADPLFEKALFNLMENVLMHGVRATEVTLRYEEKPEHLLLIIEDNGVGIPPEEKNMIFDRGYGKGSGLGLFLVREVLSITGMTIRETGAQGKGTRFEIMVPHSIYRVPEV